MDPTERIRELERKVDRLTELVEALVAERVAPKPKTSQTGPPRETFKPTPAPRRSPFVKDVRSGIDRALGGSANETLESRIGAIWLARLGVVLLMTALALGAAVTLRTDALQPVHKICLGYALALGFIVYGIAARQRHNLFAQTMLGAGLAILYFTTYAAFFIEPMRVFADRRLSAPFLAVCLVVLFTVAHWRRSQTVAGMSLFLVYYTVVVSCLEGGAERLIYGLLTCGALAVVALVFLAMHRWLLFTWAAFVASYATYIAFFLSKPAGLELGDKAYFWLANGYLALCYLVFSSACIIDARKTGEYRKNVAPMAGTNSFVFFILTWIAAHRVYPDLEWMFRGGFAVVLALFALTASLTGPRRNYLFQIFIAKAVIMLTLALQSYLSTEWLLVAIGLECLGLSFSYKRSGVVMFKGLGLFLMLVAFVGCLAVVKAAGTVSAFGLSIPANWFCCVGVPVVFIVIAWFYEHFVERVPVEKRVVSSQHVLADTIIDAHSAAVSMLHAAAAALILLTITIIDLGDHVALPYILAAESVAMAFAGLLLRTPQVDVASVLLLTSAHVCYHTFIWLGKPGFTTQPGYVPYTTALALFTYVGAYLWERYLRRVEDGKEWEHHAIAALPYLVGTVMLTTLLGQKLEAVYAPLAQNALGVALLLVGFLTGYTAVKASGVMAVAIGAGYFYRGLYNVAAPFGEYPRFLALLALFLLTFAAAERALVVLERQERTPSRLEDVIRTLFVVAGAAIGVLGLAEWSAREYLTFYWGGLGVVLMALGGLFRESRYRWAALCVFLLSIARAFYYDLMKLDLLYRFLSFAALSIAVLTVSWAYSRFRLKALQQFRSEDSEGAGPDG